MAESKKSFLLYCDSQGLINQLPDEVAGRLFKHIFAYVNDENPKTDELLINVAFEPIKAQLKRDLLAWETSKTSKSNAGILGNLKKYNIDLYNKVNSNKLTLDEALKVAESRRTSQSDEVRPQTIAKLAVNDNVNVSVNDNVSDSVIKEKTHAKNYKEMSNDELQEIFSNPPDDNKPLSISELSYYMLFSEQYAMAFKQAYPLFDYKSYLEKFYNYSLSGGKLHDSFENYAKHFFNTIRAKKL